MINKELKIEAIELLKNLIKAKSFSTEEDDAAQIIENFLKQKGVHCYRKGNNIWAWNRDHRDDTFTILLNSHIDTVRPGPDWKIDPFEPVIIDGKLHGLGSTDAGGALVALIATFLHFDHKVDIPFNLIISATAEEETSGENGIASILDDLGKIDLAIVGEPTNMRLAVAEKGLMVLDCTAQGKSGHVVYDFGENAIETAIKDINWLHSYKFANESLTLGPIKIKVTMIAAGRQHNIIPDSCKFTVDVRTTDAYSNEEILKIIEKHITSTITPRSINLNASQIAQDHLIVRAARSIGMELFISPTTSDQALIQADSVKIGPGCSEQSHTPDEFIELRAIEQGIDIYIKLLDTYAQLLKDQR